MFIIDPPSPFDTQEAWERHLTRLKELQDEHPDDATIKTAIADAESWIATLS